MKRIYLDHNATTPPHPAAVEAVRACLEEHWGNPSSAHAFGQGAKRVLDRARSQVAALIGARPEEIVFTSGGTEADNLALRSGASRGGGRILVSTLEHPAVLDTARALEARDFRLQVLPVDSEGLLDPAAVERALGPDAAILSVTLASHELGTVQPLAECAALARARGVALHTDAVQAAGRIPVDVRALGVDLLSLSGHKLYGPKGVGALFVRRGLALPPLLTGGPQEAGMRAGTENLPGIAGFGAACELAMARLEARSEQARRLRDFLQRGILEGIPGTRLNGHPERRLPNTLNISFEGVAGEDLLLNLDLEGIAVSLGAACQAGHRRPSPSVLALGRSGEEARSAVRFSLGESNTEEEILRALDALKGAVARLRGGRP